MLYNSIHVECSPLETPESGNHLGNDGKPLSDVLTPKQRV